MSEVTVTLEQGYALTAEDAERLDHIAGELKRLHQGDGAAATSAGYLDELAAKSRRGRSHSLEDLIDALATNERAGAVVSAFLARYLSADVRERCEGEVVHRLILESFAVVALEASEDHPASQGEPVEDCDDLCTCGQERFAHMRNETEPGPCHATGCGGFELASQGEEREPDTPTFPLGGAPVVLDDGSDSYSEEREQ